MNSIRDLTKYVPAFLEYSEAYPEWGCLHVVMSDGNDRDVFVLGCIHRAKEEEDTVGAGLGYLLLAMSRTQRLRLKELVGKKLDGGGA